MRNQRARAVAHISLFNLPFPAASDAGMFSNSSDHRASRARRSLASELWITSDTYLTQHSRNPLSLHTVKFLTKEHQEHCPLDGLTGRRADRSSPSMLSKFFNGELRHVGSSTKIQRPWLRFRCEGMDGNPRCRSHSGDDCVAMAVNDPRAAKLNLHCP
jgi:hypothetical protein